MLSDQDKKEIREHFAAHYWLIPRNQVAAALGGMIVTAIAIVGLSYSSVVTMLRTDAANKARQRILQLEKEASTAKQRIDGLERDSKSVIDGLRATIAEEVETAKKKVAEIEGDTKSLAKRLSTTPFDYISAKSIALIDKDGMNRMLLTSSENGSAALYLYDRQYKARMELYENNGSVGLNFLDRYGRGRMMLMMESANGVPHLAVKNNEGKLLMELYENSSGTLSLQLKDRQNNNRVELTNGETKGSYQLIFTDGKMVQKFP